jgi:hypothetical protein
MQYMIHFLKKLCILFDAACYGLSTNVAIILNDVVFSGIPLDAKVVEGYDTICKAMGHLD